MREAERVTKKKIPILFILFIMSTMFIAASLVPNVAPSTPSSPSQPSESNPQVAFNPSPPSQFSGQGINISSVMSFNGRNSTKLKANNTRSSYETRSASYSPLIPAGYTTVWQNITISNLTAVYDARAIEGGAMSATLLAKDIGNYSQFAMRFTTLDKANLTGVWLNYLLSGSDPVKLHVVSTGTTSSTTPSGGTNIGEATLPTGTGWSYMALNPPVTISRGNYYWIVVNASSINTTQTSFGWRYRYDQGTGVEDLILAAGQRWIVSSLQWRDEADFTLIINKYINFLSVLKVLPVDDNDVSKVKTYASPSHVAMNETNSGISLLSNTTNIPATISTFLLKTNTSVTFTANWTARFASPQTWKVATNYMVLNGTTFWNATFASDRRPSGVLPKTVYNRTITVSPISANWTFADLTKNITNAYVNATKTYIINFTATLGSNYIFITQTDDVNRTDVWMANWTIKAKSSYSITVLIPSKAIQWKPFDVTVSAKLLPSNRTLLIYNQTGDTTYNKTFFSVSTSPVNYPVTLNASGNYNIIVFERVFDRIVGRNEASFFNASWITVLKPLTRISLNVTTVSATWGDTIHIKVNFQNATGGVVKPFPSSPMPTFSVGSYVLTAELPWVHNGSYLLNYPSSLLSSAGTYNLRVNGTYTGGYDNRTMSFTLNLAKVQMAMSIVACQGAVLPYSSLTVSANLTYYGNGSAAPNGLTLRFNFIVTYTDNSQTTTTKYGDTTNGAAMVSLPATTEMSSISVNVSYAGDPIRGGAHDERIGIAVPPLRTQIGLESAAVNATWGDEIHIGVKFLNATQGATNEFPSTLSPVFNVSYPGGYVVPSVLNEGEGWYSFNISSRRLSSAGSKQLNITATYQGIYTNTTTLSLHLDWITMTLKLTLGQVNVTAGSSLSVSATLKYPNGTAVQNFKVVFRFNVTYGSGTTSVFNINASTLNGEATYGFPTTADMRSISVEAIYAGDEIRASAGTEKQEATVVQRATGGFPVIMIGAAGGIGALAVVGVVLAVRRRKRGKEVEYKKTAALRQAASLAQLVVVERKSGRAVFSRNLSTEETVDPHLISGFLSANESILQEVFRGDKECLRYADYGKYKVITCIGENVMTTLFCAVGADKQLEGVLELEDVLNKFTKEFERKYGRLVSVWDGNMAAFRGAENIVSDVFAQGISMLSPYMLDQEALAKAKLNGLESDACEEARRLSAWRGVFFITKVIEYLLTEKGVSRGKLMDTINSLAKRGVFKQLSMIEAEEIVKAGGQER